MSSTFLETSREELPCWCGCGCRWLVSRGELREDGGGASFVVMPTRHDGTAEAWLAIGEGRAPTRWAWVRTGSRGKDLAAGLTDQIPFSSMVPPAMSRAEVLAEPAFKTWVFAVHDELLRVHDDLRHLFFPQRGRDYSFRVPDCVFAQPPERRSPRNQQNFADCEGRLFLRALLPVPVSDGSELRLGVWVEVPKETFFRVVEVWDDPQAYLALSVSGTAENVVSLGGRALKGEVLTLSPRTADHCLFVKEASTPWLVALMKERFSIRDLPALVGEIERSLKQRASA